MNTKTMETNNKNQAEYLESLESLESELQHLGYTPCYKGWQRIMSETENGVWCINLHIWNKTGPYVGPYEINNNFYYPNPDGIDFGDTNRYVCETRKYCQGEENQIVSDIQDLVNPMV